MAFRIRAAFTGLIAALLMCSPGERLLAAIPADTTLRQRQEAALRHVAANLTPLYRYTETRSDGDRICVDVDALIAQLELARRRLPGGLGPAAAAPLAQHIAQAISRFTGTGQEEGPWHWNKAGTPSPMGAAADLAYALHRYGRDWPDAAKEAIRVAVEESNWPPHGEYLCNGDINLVAAELLAGEALSRPALWERGVRNLAGQFRMILNQGAHEVNAPLYTGWHFAPLIFLQELRDDRSRSRARILLEYELLVQAHLYLPGGGLGPPQTRDYSGGADDGGAQSLLPVLWVLIGDPALAELLPHAYSLGVIAAATDYTVPEVIRSIFLDKGEGYTFWTRIPTPQGSDRTAYGVYALGQNGEEVTPWQAVVLPEGAASFGVAYGARLTGIDVTSGVYARTPSNDFAILYQYQPEVIGDTDDSGDRISGGGLNDDPDDFISELYDYERLVYNRTLLMLWDPTTRGKPAGVVRTYQDTRVHLPNYAALGGEMIRAGNWRVGRMGNAYIAYYPLGRVVAEEARDDGRWTYLRLGGPSGGIVELATTSEFATLEDYARNLGSRRVTFSGDPLWVEMDAYGGKGRKLVSLRLDYRPERRVVAGAEQSEREALGHGLMESPWATWDPSTQRLRIARAGYRSIVYDWSRAVIGGDSGPR